MRTKRLRFGAAVLLALSTPVAAQAPAPDLTPQKVLAICDKALIAAMEGRNARAAVEIEIKDMLAEQQKAVLVVCGIYLSGAVAALKHVHETAPLPVGRSKSI
jgi:hypothetical protein